MVEKEKNKGLKITFRTSKRRNSETKATEMVKVATKIGGLDVAVTYINEGEETYYSVVKGDNYYLYKKNGDVAEMKSRSKNPYDFDKIVYGQTTL